MWEFAKANPFTAFCILLLLCVSVESTLFRCWNRLVRHLNIRAKGWPPPHLDADGDLKTKSD